MKVTIHLTKYSQTILLTRTLISVKNTINHLIRNKKTTVKVQNHQTHKAIIKVSYQTNSMGAPSLVMSKTGKDMKIKCLKREPYLDFLKDFIPRELRRTRKT